MSDSESTLTRPDSPELRLIARRAMVDPVRLAAALNDPLSPHITTAELHRVAASLNGLRNQRSQHAVSAVVYFAPRWNAALDAAITHRQQKERDTDG